MMEAMKRETGYSLIEVVIATAIFLVFAAAVVQTVGAAQTSGNRTAGQNGAQLAINFLADRLQQGRSNYAPIPEETAGQIDVTKTAQLTWGYGQLTEPYQGRKEDYAKPDLYRAQIRYMGAKNLSVGSMNVRQASYEIEVCYKTIAGRTGEECITQNVSGPMPDPTTQPDIVAGGRPVVRPPVTPPTTTPRPVKNFVLTYGPSESQPAFPVVATRACITTYLRRIVNGVPVPVETQVFEITATNRPRMIERELPEGTYELQSVHNLSTDCSTDSLVALRIQSLGQSSSKAVRDNTRTDTVRLTENRRVVMTLAPMEWLLRLAWVDRNGSAYRVPDGSKQEPRLLVTTGDAKAAVGPNGAAIINPGSTGSAQINLVAGEGNENLLRVRGAMNSVSFATYGTPNYTGRVQCFETRPKVTLNEYNVPIDYGIPEDDYTGCQAIDMSRTRTQGNLQVISNSTSTMFIRPMQPGTITDVPVTISYSRGNVQLRLSGVNRSFATYYHCFEGMNGVIIYTKWLAAGGKFQDETKPGFIPEPPAPVVNDKQTVTGLQELNCEMAPFGIRESAIMNVAKVAYAEDEETTPPTKDGEPTKLDNFKPIIDFPTEVGMWGDRGLPSKGIHSTIYNPYLYMTAEGDLLIEMTAPIVGDRYARITIPEYLYRNATEAKSFRRMRYEPVFTQLEHVIRTDYATTLYAEFFSETKDVNGNWILD